MFRWIWIALLISFSGPFSSAQLAPLNNVNNPQTRALNNYVYFINESIHGMLVVHRLLENFNLDINKYVDLDSYQINFYSNKDLPEDIFEDSDNWFYDISPYEWYDIIIEDNAYLAPEKVSRLMAETNYIKKLITDINGQRFSIESLISEKNLEDPEQLQLVYDELESCVVLFDSFYSAQKKLEQIIYREQAPKGVYAALLPLYRDFRSVLTAVRNKEDKGIDILIKKFRTTLSGFDLNAGGKDLKDDISFHKLNIVTQGGNGVASAAAFAKGTEPPKEYELYGSYYYYYNSDIINKFNRYGSGVVFEMNSILDKIGENSPRFTELPHYYKVIYPRKLEKLNILTGSAQPLDALPSILEGRKLQKKTEGEIQVDAEIIEVEVFDHMIQDGDIVSLNFNGEWILKRHKLTSTPFLLRLKLNPSGKNFLVLHAENLGARPPNTMAISYSAGGKKKQYIMNSDLNTSELIEITTK